MAKRYRALRTIYYCDAVTDRRIKKGESIPREKRNETRVAAGEIVDNLPAHALAACLRRGLVEEVTDDEA